MSRTVPTGGSTTNLRRLQKEFADVDKEIKSTGSNTGIMKIMTVNNDLTHMNVVMKGPSGTPYEDGIFLLDLSFPLNFPFKPPTVKFMNQVYHPNINNGDICLDILKDNWSPALTVHKVLLSISSLLNEPNPRDPLSGDVARVYTDDRNLYNKTAREWAKKYSYNPEKTRLSNLD